MQGRAANRSRRRRLPPRLLRAPGALMVGAAGALRIGVLARCGGILPRRLSIYINLRDTTTYPGA